MNEAVAESKPLTDPNFCGLFLKPETGSRQVDSNMLVTG